MNTKSLDPSEQEMQAMKPAVPMTRYKNVPAIERALAIIDLVSSEHGVLNSSMIAHRLEIPRSSAHHLLGTLTAGDVLQKDNSGSYKLGVHILTWAGRFREENPLLRQFSELVTADPTLAKYTLTLSQRDGKEVVYLASHESPDPLGINFRIGMRLPAAFTATGKSMLSQLRDVEINALYNNKLPAPLTHRSVQTLTDLRQDLDRARLYGYALDDGQIREGMYCIGVALPVNMDMPPTGIAISLLASEYKEKSEVIINALLNFREYLSTRLDW